MFYRLRQSLAESRFRRQIARIFDTDRVRLRRGGVTVVSMVRTPDLARYLLALKSFCICIEAGKVVAIIDRDAPSEFRRRLTWHVPEIELVALESIPVGHCQHGGTWERLLYVVDRSEREYVVQLDADTLTLGADLSEVRECISDNRSFMLGGGPASWRRRILSMEAAAASTDPEDDYVGAVAQRRLNEYPGSETLRYARGSSAFAGFAPGGIGRRRVEEFHVQMANFLGARWKEWGSEQCASNFAIANSPGAVVLPWPQYSNFHPEYGLTEATRFVHFLGTVRYHDGCYSRLGRRTIDRIVALQQSSGAA